MKAKIENTGEEITIRGTLTYSLDGLYRLNDDVVVAVHNGEEAIIYFLARFGAEYAYLADVHIEKNAFCREAYSFGFCVAQPIPKEQSPAFIEESQRLEDLHGAGKVGSRLAQPR